MKSRNSNQNQIRIELNKKIALMNIKSSNESQISRCSDTKTRRETSHLTSVTNFTSFGRLRRFAKRFCYYFTVYLQTRSRKPLYTFISYTYTMLQTYNVTQVLKPKKIDVTLLEDVVTFSSLIAS